MIRERLEQDLEVLTGIVEGLAPLPEPDAAPDARSWLRERDGGLCWVFDMAPVRVTPTANVAGHVQMYPLIGQDPGWTAIGQLVVRPEKHAHGIARYLLRESVRHVRESGHIPVLDLDQCLFRSEELFRRCGFDSLPDSRGGGSLLVHGGEVSRARSRTP